jgi:hypothetical protein
MAAQTLVSLRNSRKEIIHGFVQGAEQWRRKAVIPGSNRIRMNGVSVQRENLQRSLVRIDNPVFAYPCPSVERSFGEEVVDSIRGTEHFNNQVRRSLNAASNEMHSAARQDDDEVRLDGVGAWQKDIEWRRPPTASYRRHKGNEQGDPDRLEQLA